MQCKCGLCAVDGGHDYLRRSAADSSWFIDLSEFIENSSEFEERPKAFT